MQFLEKLHIFYSRFCNILLFSVSNWSPVETRHGMSLLGFWVIHEFPSNFLLPHRFFFVFLRAAKSRRL